MQTSHVKGRLREIDRTLQSLLSAHSRRRLIAQHRSLWAQSRRRWLRSSPASIDRSDHQGRPIRDIHHPAQMLRSQPALPPFAAFAKSGNDHTHRLRNKADFQFFRLKVRFLVVAHALIEVMHILKAVDRRRDALHPGLYLQR